MAIPSTTTISNQLECFISALHSYATLKSVYGIGSRVSISKVIFTIYCPPTKKRKCVYLLFADLRESIIYQNPCGSINTKLGHTHKAIEKVSKYKEMVVGISVTRLGDLLDFWQVFKAFSNN